MNLAQMIHQRWAASTALCALLPAARVFTGLSVDPTPPYAVLSKQTDQPHAGYSDGTSVRRVGLRIELFHDIYDAAVAVARRIAAALDGSDFALTVSDRVVRMRMTDRREQQQLDGVWQFTFDFDCMILQAYRSSPGE